MFFDLFCCSSFSTLLTYHLHLARLGYELHTSTKELKSSARNSNHKKWKYFEWSTQAHDPWYLLSRFYLSLTHQHQKSDSCECEREKSKERYEEQVARKPTSQIWCESVETGLSNISTFFYYVFSVFYLFQPAQHTDQRDFLLVSHRKSCEGETHSREPHSWVYLDGVQLYNSCVAVVRIIFPGKNHLQRL